MLESTKEHATDQHLVIVGTPTCRGCSPTGIE
jgi:hypothetical protein